ncbi:MAG: hypothetical protein JSS82_03470 [Bacteroidetes bacterium]|nr:hypothetical protein [Bacteroidota bacterium]
MRLMLVEDAAESRVELNAARRPLYQHVRIREVKQGAGIVENRNAVRLHSVVANIVENIAYWKCISSLIKRLA